MYYEEKYINNILMCRAGPSGVWLPKSTVTKKKYKYVWLNLKDGTFSNSWDGSESYITKSKEDFEKEMIKLAEDNDPYWKLIKYECISDSDFEFFNLMKLK